MPWKRLARYPLYLRLTVNCVVFFYQYTSVRSANCSGIRLFTVRRHHSPLVRVGVSGEFIGLYNFRFSIRPKAALSFSLRALYPSRPCDFVWLEYDINNRNYWLDVRIKTSKCPIRYWNVYNNMKWVGNIFIQPRLNINKQNTRSRNVQQTIIKFQLF